MERDGERDEGRAPHQARQGPSLEGLKYPYHLLPKEQAMEQTQNKTLTAATKTIQKPSNFEDEHRGVEGPMGRAFFRGVTSGDLDTEWRNAPPSRVRPQGAEVSTAEQRKNLFTPKGMGSALSPLC